jgi:hypothetical protein
MLIRLFAGLDEPFLFHNLLKLAGRAERSKIGLMLQINGITMTCLNGFSHARECRGAIRLGCRRYTRGGDAALGIGPRQVALSD